MVWPCAWWGRGKVSATSPSSLKSRGKIDKSIKDPRSRDIPRGRDCTENCGKTHRWKVRWDWASKEDFLGEATMGKSFEQQARSYWDSMGWEWGYSRQKEQYRRWMGVVLTTNLGIWAWYWGFKEPLETPEMRVRGAWSDFHFSRFTLTATVRRWYWKI